MTSGTGNCVITASQAGNLNYQPAEDVAHTVVASKKAQTITFTAPDSPAVFDSSFSVSPTSDSDLDVSVSVSGVCDKLMNGSIHMTSGTGNCVITASQAGNLNYQPAEDVAHTVVASKKAQTITFTPLANKTLGDGDFNVTAIGGGSGNPVTFSSTSASVCTVSDSMVHLLTVGTCSVTASQAGDDNWLTAIPVVQSFSVNYRWDGFLQPINDTAHQIGTLMSQFRLGSTVPAKFQLKKLDGTLVQSASTIAFSQSGNLGTCGTAVTPETVLMETATAGAAFRWDATAQQYIYNWSTKGLKAGKYRIAAVLDDPTGKTRSYVDICLG
jgi:hypothetical protein